MMRVGGLSFRVLEETYVEMCRCYGWPSHVLPSSNGRVFSKAFKHHAIVMILNGRDTPLGVSHTLNNTPDRNRKMRCGLEAAMKAIVDTLPARGEHWSHIAKVIGCGCVFEGTEPATCLVMGGVEVRIQCIRTIKCHVYT